MMILASISTALAAEQSVTSQADAFFEAQDWEKAAQAYESVVATNPSDGAAWHRLGLARYNLKRYTLAISAFEEAAKNGGPAARAQYNIAACYALEDEKGKAFDALAKAVAAGFVDFKTLQTDTDLQSLRDDPRFQKLLSQVMVEARPCENLPIYRQFDFWVGDWDVFTPAGEKAGTNNIQKAAGGCMLLENWTSANGIYSGKSINFYDASKKKWVQVWADSSGEVIPTEGEFRNGAMRLAGELIDRHGKKSLYRGTWTPLDDGRVRQFLEESKDGGKSWSVWFDGTYTRQASTQE